MQTVPLYTSGLLYFDASPVNQRCSNGPINWKPLNFTVPPSEMSMFSGVTFYPSMNTHIHVLHE